jgi:hypothetical protein
MSMVLIGGPRSRATSATDFPTYELSDRVILLCCSWCCWTAWYHEHEVRKKHPLNPRSKWTGRRTLHSDKTLAIARAG